MCGTFLAMGAALLASGIPLALLMRHGPEQHGYAPDGRGNSNDARERSPGAPGVLDEVNFTLGQTLRTRAFWLLAAAMVLGQGSATVAFMYWPPLLMERGLPVGTPFIAADFVPLLGILIFGYLGDRFSKRHLLALAAALHSVRPAALMPLVSFLRCCFTPWYLAWARERCPYCWPSGRTTSGAGPLPPLSCRRGIP